jgi:hypothetical protein
VVARVKGGSLDVTQEAMLGSFVRVDLGNDRPGWVPKSKLASGGGAGGELAFHLNHMPPELTVAHGDTLVTRSESLQVSGKAVDDRRVRDLYIFVGARKVFYESNRGNGGADELAFDTEVPLHGGINYVTVFARERDDIVSRRTFVVRRDAKDGSLMDTPRFDDDLFGTGMHEEL